MKTLPGLLGCLAMLSVSALAELQPVGNGSGFFITTDGYFITNNHVIDKASDVQVTLDDGRTLGATVVGADKKTDLALLKIKDKGTFPFVEFGSDTPRSLPYWYKLGPMVPKEISLLLIWWQL